MKFHILVLSLSVADTSVAVQVRSNNTELHSKGFDSIRSQSAKSGRLRNILPIAWVHVPKCGSTLMNAMINLPGACDLASQGASVRTDVAELCNKRNYPGGMFFNAAESCPNAFSFPDDEECTHQCLSLGHSGIGAVYNTIVRGHGAIMLRQPEQRIISGYNDHWHSWPWWHYDKEPNNLLEYARVVSGCAVKMITREGTQHGRARNIYQKQPGIPPPPCGDPEPATIDEANIAVERLRSGFVFVGLTDDWDMSICLFHDMLGGTCVASEFADDSPRNNSMSDVQYLTSDSHAYDTSVLEGFKDVYDGLLYGEAKNTFEKNLEMYGVTASRCAKCKQQAIEGVGSKQG